MRSNFGMNNISGAIGQFHGFETECSDKQRQSAIFWSLGGCSAVGAVYGRACHASKVVQRASTEKDASCQNPR